MSCELILVGESKLPEDHFKVFQSLKNFRYVEEEELNIIFKNRFKKNPREHGLEKESGGSSKNRICDYSELRKIEESYNNQNKKFIKKKETLDITGIPQGTAISAILSNIFMIDVDIALKRYIEKMGGCYKRYCDDIFIAMPIAASFDYVENYVKIELKKHCDSSIDINPDMAFLSLQHSPK